MHGLGNDFVVIDATTQRLELDRAAARAIADRRRGVGCDQILVVEPPRRAGADFGYRILNADGSEAGQCGNGARCFARFVREQKLTAKSTIVVDVPDGQITIEHCGGHDYRVALGVPVFEPAQIPMTGFTRADRYRLSAAGQTVSLAALAIGNPHAVLSVDDIDRADVELLGPAIESHPSFTERVNVGFMQVMARDHIRLRVYERGAGETLACGSGAAAAAVAGIAAGVLDHRVVVDLAGGRLRICWNGSGDIAYLTGSAARVFAGELVL